MSKQFRLVKASAEDFPFSDGDPVTRRQLMMAKFDNIPTTAGADVAQLKFGNMQKLQLFCEEEPEVEEIDEEEREMVERRKDEERRGVKKKRRFGRKNAHRWVLQDAQGKETEGAQGMYSMNSDPPNAVWGTPTHARNRIRARARTRTRTLVLAYYIYIYIYVMRATCGVHICWAAVAGGLQVCCSWAKLKGRTRSMWS